MRHPEPPPCGHTLDYHKGEPVLCGKPADGWLNHRHHPSGRGYNYCRAHRSEAMPYASLWMAILVIRELAYKIRFATEIARLDLEPEVEMVECPMCSGHGRIMIKREVEPEPQTESPPRGASSAP